MNTINNNLAIFQTGTENKQTIIFIHGFPFDHKMWDKQVDYFKKDFHCISYDIRGLGESPAGDGQYTIEGFVDDLFNIINELELKKPVICGLSMGGYIALRAAGDEQARLLAQALGGHRLQALDRRVLLPDVVPHLGAGHRLAHLGRRERERVGAKIDDIVHGGYLWARRRWTARRPNSV